MNKIILPIHILFSFRHSLRYLMKRRLRMKLTFEATKVTYM